MSTLQETTGQQLEAHIMEIYSCLFRIYRHGDYERELEGYRYGWPELDNNADFYDYRAPEGIEFTQSRIKYAEGVESLYQLILFVEQNRASWVKEHQVDILKIRNLIYEVKDYSLAVPLELGQFFIEQARAFNEHAKRDEVKRFADELSGEASARQADDGTARLRVIKVQVISALAGVNHLYRSHKHENYEEALEIVENIETYVKMKVPGQHLNKRESFGLIGLTMYLKGRLLSAIGKYDSAQKAYAQSSDAYVARLDQKNDFYRQGFITREQYEDKKIITLRRAALVSAFGVGYLASINGRVSKALAALRMSRAVLRQDVRDVYQAYTDILYYACRRAEGSSERQTIEYVIKGIEDCRETLAGLVPDTHYFHRAGIELATALQYRVKSDQKRGEVTERTFEDHSNAMELLAAAIKHAEGEEGRPKNQRLLTEALFIRSYVRRCEPGATPEKKHSNLLKAEIDAKRSKTQAAKNLRMSCEALIARGSVDYELSKYYQSINNEAEFHKKSEAAHGFFKAAIKRNRGKNVRIEAVCYLKLTKLFLLDSGSVALAHDQYKKWRGIEHRVEHAFCHYMAQEIDRRLSENGAFLIIDAELSLSRPVWTKRLENHLINTMLISLSEEISKSQHSESELRPLILAALMEKLEFKKTKAGQILKEYGLVKRLQSLNK